MKTIYVIEDITNGGFWDSHCRRFRGWLFTEKFSSEEEALTFAENGKSINNFNNIVIMEEIENKVKRFAVEGYVFNKLKPLIKELYEK